MNVWYLELYFRTQMSETSGHKNYARETFRNVLVIPGSPRAQPACAAARISAAAAYAGLTRDGLFS